MRRGLFFILAAVLFHLATFAQPGDGRSGNWVGVISIVNLPIYFHFEPIGGGSYKGEWSSISEHAFGMACKSVIFRGDSLLIEMGGVAASFRGKYLPGQDSAAGDWIQNGQAIPMGLRRSGRPQTPAPPFPYRSDSVEYDNADGSVHLGATLTRPLAGRKYPAVILITGSGLQDRDEMIFDHRPFAVIADFLTRRGLAVLRVDDRTIGKSRGDVSKATSEDFADDVMTSLRYLKSRGDIDTVRIGLIGHSEGGLIAPMVYARWPHLAFLVLLAGAGVPGSMILLRQQTAPAQSLGPAAYASYHAFIKDKIELLNDNYGQADSITLLKIKELYEKWAAGIPDSIAAVLPTKKMSSSLFVMMERQELKPWVRFFCKTDPAVYLKQVHCPVLALNGARDIQVDAGENIPAIRKALVSAGAPVETKIFPGLNHLFQHCRRCDLSEYASNEETISPEVIRVMADWISKIVKL